LGCHQPGISNLKEFEEFKEFKEFKEFNELQEFRICTADSAKCAVLVAFGNVFA
jgi:hypothetical protein